MITTGHQYCCGLCDAKIVAAEENDREVIRCNLDRGRLNFPDRVQSFIDDLTDAGIAFDTKKTTREYKYISEDI